MSTTTAPSPAHCPECAPRPPLRNHWFWGKCIVPRDLTDEQFFFLDKLRLHNQRLHGSGIVCGLELHPHPNENCRDRLMILTPGSAVDCCGHDILVLEDNVVDLHAYDAIRDLLAKPPVKPSYRLRFCIRYRECPTEEVPVLYDECACDDTRCAPNRILETFSIEVQIDPPDLVHQVLQPRFTRVTTLGIVGTTAVALDEKGGRILVLAGSSLLELDATTHLLGAPRSLGAPGRILTVAPDGSRAGLVFGGDAANDPTLTMLDIGGPVAIATAAEHHGTLTGSHDSRVELVETGGGALIAVIDTLSGARLYIGPKPDPTAMPEHSDLAPTTAGLAVSSDATKAYLVEPGSAHLRVVALDQPKLPQSTVTLTGATGAAAQADNLALVATTAPDRLAVVDRANPRLHIVDPATGKVEGSVALDHLPVDLAITPGGHWALVIIDDGTDGFVQPVNLQLLRQKKPVQAGTPVKIGPKAGKPVLSGDARRLYVPITDGVAVFDIDDVDCGALLRDDDCPDCLTPDCLVLATIEHWSPGFSLEALGHTPLDPVADAAKKIARIDNRKDRTRLPSTQAIAAAVECLLEHAGASGPGPQGPPGPASKDGTNGKDAIDKTLTHICGINWRHGQRVKLDELLVPLDGDQRVPAFAIAFSNTSFPGSAGTVNPADLNDISFTVLMEHIEVQGENVARICWCQLPSVDVLGVQFAADCDTHSPAVTKPLPGGLCNGALYQFDAQRLQLVFRTERAARTKVGYTPVVRFKVLVQGDLIRDLKDRGLDANHLPPWLGTPGTVTGDGIAGGLFESWFSIE